MFELGKWYLLNLRYVILKGNFMDEIIKESFYKQVLLLFRNAKKSVAAAVNTTMVYSY